MAVSGALKLAMGGRLTLSMGRQNDGSYREVGGIG